MTISTARVRMLPSGPQKVDDFRWFLSTTPGKTLIRMAAMVIVALFATACSIGVIEQIRTAVWTIGVATEPSIIASQNARVLISDIDANSINDTLTDGAASGTGIDTAGDRNRLTDVMMDATSNITFKETETPAIRAMYRGLDMYDQAIGEARAIYHKDPWVGLQRVKWASRVLREFVVPHAEALKVANLQPLEDAYGDYVKHAWLLGIESVFAMFVLGGVILNLQKFIARKSFLNWFVAAGVIVLSLSTSWLIYTVIAEYRLTVSAKTNAFDSISYLYEAKALVYEMNADESLWLVDSDTRPTTQGDFSADKAKLLGQVSPDLINKLHAALKAEIAGDPRTATKLTPQDLSGLLGKEMSNVTFGVAERQSATDAVEWFIRYIAIDTEIRRLELTGDHAGAVRLCLGVAENQSNWVFGKLDAAIDAALKSNTDAFDQEIAHAISMIDEAPWVVFGGILISVALSLVGASRFYSEYR